jgi:hypothetical protein
MFMPLRREEVSHMKTASLEQVQRLLSYIEDIPSDQIELALGSGFLGEVIRSGNLTTVKSQMNLEKFKQLFWIIGILTGYEGITVTVPHVPLKRLNRGEDFQLHCWKGAYGYIRDGHVDSGTAKGVLLAETFMSKRLSDCKCCYPQDLEQVGIQPYSGYTWMRNVEEDCDILTLVAAK